MAYTPPASNAVDFTLSGGYTPPANNAVDFVLDADPGGSTGLQDMKLDIAAGAIGYADTILDLSAYYQSLNDAQLDIAVHALVLADLVLNISLTDGIVLIDKILDLAAYYQALADAKLDIEAWEDNTQDARFDGFLAAWASKDKPLDIHAGAQVLETLAMGISAAKDLSDSNARLDMWLSNGFTLQDGRLDIITTDGRKLKDIGLDIAVIEVMPTFRAVYAMHLNSVITEI
jgi:hypothetical protein